MKMISYIQHLHKAIFIVLLILALTACDSLGGGPGGTPDIVLEYPAMSSDSDMPTQIKTYANGASGTQRYKAFSFTIVDDARNSDGTILDPFRREFNDDLTYPDQLEEIVLGNAMRASEAQKAALRAITMVTFPIALFTEDNTRPTLTRDAQRNLNQQLKLLYNELTGEVKFSIKVEERPPVGHPGVSPDDRRWTSAELGMERYQIKIQNGTITEDIPNGIYRLAIRKATTDRTLAPLKATGIDLVFLQEPEMIGDGTWYVIGELHKDPHCPNLLPREASPKNGVSNCMR